MYNPTTQWSIKIRHVQKSYICSSFVLRVLNEWGFRLPPLKAVSPCTDVPSGPPRLDVSRLQWSPGEVLRANCTFPGGRTPSELHWYINSKKVSKRRAAHHTFSGPAREKLNICIKERLRNFMLANFSWVNSACVIYATRQGIWRCMRTKEAPENHVIMVQDMYEGAWTQVTRSVELELVCIMGLP